MVSLCSFEMTKKIVELLCILGQVGGDAFKFIGRIFVGRRVCQPVAFYGDLAETLCNLAWHTLTLQPAVGLGQSRFRITKRGHWQARALFGLSVERDALLLGALHG
jgi:hypothetical protein